ncbi:hypothetical protein BUALT_Bualt05G0014100 [Buddleja alternifolia]|uniref:Early flowering 3 n=1 Tax=Buddleja alternifolia TaxID=168488 RepID=A0AAV6XRJ5_9LAMI|nr:hypothetical protein BUALT_Bualt05G0014100 [Buddleja alternifolia]
MKRLKDDKRIMGPMFPRLHVNDTEKGGPKAPPRNKMALYEQLSIPSQRFSHAPNNIAASLRSPSSQQPSRHQSDKRYSQYSEMSTPLTQVELRKKLDDDDFTVPIFSHPVPSQECAKYTNNVHMEKFSPSFPSYLNHIMKFQEATKTGILNMRPEGKSQNEENMAALDERNSPALRGFQSEDRNVVNDLSNNTESREEESCRTLEMKKLERGDSVTSVLDCISVQDITPDDVVGIIGQKRFWKARRAIANQQRVFAVQLFELHKLIKVQRILAASPHLLLEDSAYLSETIKPLPRKKSSLSDPLKPIPNISKQKVDPEKPSRKQECSAENTLAKPSFSSIQKDVDNNSPAPSDQNARPWSFNQPNGHHWLIPVMSPSEGLIYKPYPGPGFVDPAHRGGGHHVLNPMVGNFPTSTYGVPAPHPQYQFPSFIPTGPHSYFPPFGMPVMNPATFQMNSPDFPSRVEGFPQETEGTEVQASTASSPSERIQVSKASSGQEGRNMLPLFPEAAPAIGQSNPSPQPPEPELVVSTRVIKVVPHNARTATESAARIFRSIQEERKRYDLA